MISAGRASIPTLPAARRHSDGSRYRLAVSVFGHDRGWPIHSGNWPRLLRVCDVEELLLLGNAPQPALWPWPAPRACAGRSTRSRARHDGGHLRHQEHRPGRGARQVAEHHALLLPVPSTTCTEQEARVAHKAIELGVQHRALGGRRRSNSCELSAFCAAIFAASLRKAGGAVAEPDGRPLDYC
jgi:hypothetical protein